MRDEILDIVKKIYHNHLTIETGTDLLLGLFNVVGQSEQLFAFGEHLHKHLGFFLITEHLQQEIDSFKGK